MKAQENPHNVSSVKKSQSSESGTVDDHIVVGNNEAKHANEANKSLRPSYNTEDRQLLTRFASPFSYARQQGIHVKYANEVNKSLRPSYNTEDRQLLARIAPPFSYARLQGIHVKYANADKIYPTAMAKHACSYFHKSHFHLSLG